MVSEEKQSDRFFLEVVLQAADSAFLERDEVEDTLQEALGAAGLGEVTGAGAGLGVSNLDVEVTELDAGLALVRRVLRELEVPPSTTIYLNEGDQSKGTGKVTPYRVYEPP
jgi:hypothetical protein